MGENSGSRRWDLAILLRVEGFRLETRLLGVLPIAEQDWMGN